MHRELEFSSRLFHDEYIRRHIHLPEPLERTRHDLRWTIGQSLIHIGERLARVDHAPSLDEAA